MLNNKISIEEIEEILPKQFLHQSVWIGDTLQKDVRIYLLLNALKFINYLGIPNLRIEDITLTGSIANYNWNDKSDIDLHIIFNFKQILDDVEFVSEFLRLKKNIWNDKFDINIKGIEVELYSQNSKEEHMSSGVYSVMKNEWISHPERFENSLNYEEIINEYSIVIDTINSIMHIEDVDEKLEGIDDFKNWLRDYRQQGLRTDGELSTNNIVFKLLKYKNILAQINDIIINLVNNKFSL